MSIFWQHVGDANSHRDFPKTLGSSSEGLKQFVIEDIDSHLVLDPAFEQSDTESAFQSIGSTPFQIWGFPSGAASTLAKAEKGDLFLFLDTATEYGSFQYVGRLLFMIPGRQWNFSDVLWGEKKFSLVGLFRGELIRYPWTKFWGIIRLTYQTTTCSTADDRPAPEDETEIEVTPKMIEAGVRALDAFSGSYPDYLLVAEVYKAMELRFLKELAS